MGLAASAELIYGIPVLAFNDEDGEPTRFWDEEDEDWISLPGGLDLQTFGHYEDPDNHRAILTLASFEHHRGDCWVSVRDLDILEQKYREDLTDALEAADMEEALDGGNMGWYLVASYG